MVLKNNFKARFGEQKIRYFRLLYKNMCEKVYEKAERLRILWILQYICYANAGKERKLGK
jgi:hypothetical protein